MRPTLVIMSATLLVGCDLFTGSGGSTGQGSPTPGAPPEAPLVLAHGFFGFDTFAGVDFATYFYGVRDELQAHGEPLVFTPAVDPFADSVTRGEQLLAAVEDIVATTGAEQVNLVGHSQGGLDARYVASVRPDLIASITTISTPHGGTPVADIATGLVPFPVLQDVLDAVVRLAGAPLWDAAGNETSLFASLDQLSTSGAAAFAADHPLDPSLPVYSIAGRTDLHLGGSACDVQGAPAFIATWDAERDPADPLFLVTEPLLDGGLFTAPYPNDGLVRVVDARLGTFLGCIPADHLDQIGHLLGDGAGLFNSFDHERFYIDLAVWLRQQGH